MWVEFGKTRTVPEEIRLWIEIKDMQHSIIFNSYLTEPCNKIVIGTNCEACNLAISSCEYGIYPVYDTCVMGWSRKGDPTPLCPGAGEYRLVDVEDMRHYYPWHMPIPLMPEVTNARHEELEEAD